MANLSRDKLTKMVELAKARLVEKREADLQAYANIGTRLDELVVRYGMWTEEQMAEAVVEINDLEYELLCDIEATSELGDVYDPDGLVYNRMHPRRKRL